VSAADRILQCTRFLLEGRDLSTAKIRRVFGVSQATAKRDMAGIRKHLPVVVVKRPEGVSVRMRDVGNSFPAKKTRSESQEPTHGD